LTHIDVDWHVKELIVEEARYSRWTYIEVASFLDSFSSHMTSLRGKSLWISIQQDLSKVSIHKSIFNLKRKWSNSQQVNVQRAQGERHVERYPWFDTMAQIMNLKNESREKSDDSCSSVGLNPMSPAFPASNVMSIASLLNTPSNLDQENDREQYTHTTTIKTLLPGE
jgi:hypothetical protein